MSQLAIPIKHAVENLVQDLVAQSYSKIERDGRCGRLTPEDLHQAIVEYGRTLVELPEEGWDLADIYPLQGVPGSIAIDLPLWTKEQGRSDLTLFLTATLKGSNVCIEIDDIRVP